MQKRNVLVKWLYFKQVYRKQCFSSNKQITEKLEKKFFKLLKSIFLKGLKIFATKRKLSNQNVVSVDTKALRKNIIFCLKKWEWETSVKIEKIILPDNIISDNIIYFSHIYPYACFWSDNNEKNDKTMLLTVQNLFKCFFSWVQFLSSSFTVYSSVTLQGV